MSNDEMIAVIQGQADGKEIEWRSVNFDETWKPYGNGTRFAFDQNEYRVKPELPEPPKPRGWWIRPEKKEWEDFLILDHAPAQPNAFTWVHVREVLPDEEGKA